MTLSHCWGDGQHIKLRRTCSESFKNGIALEDLPRTFQDAVTTARRLKISYLWIDSLCILQDKDDLSDWFREAADMDRIYGQSYCNISAAAADNASVGLFMTRDPRNMRTTIDFGTGVSSEEPQKFELLNLHLWYTHVTRAPLNCRAWVMQERFLSPRILHFAKDQLLWECRELQAAESFPNGIPKAIGLDTMAKYKRYVEHETAASNNADTKPINIWMDIAHLYSATKLTFASDKLVALSGIAKKFKQVMGDDYIAGMWQKDIETQLLWFVSGVARFQKRPQVPTHYRAPSWAWTSITRGEVKWHYFGKKSPTARVTNIQLDYVSEDKTGAITGGYLDLEGYLKPLYVRWDTFPPEGRPKEALVEGLKFQNGDLKFHDMDSELYEDVETLLEKVDSFYYVPVQTSSEGIEIGSTGSMLKGRGLILQLAVPDQGLFRRVGLAEGGMQLCESLPPEYGRQFGEGWQTIRII